MLDIPFQKHGTDFEEFGRVSFEMQAYVVTQVLAHDASWHVLVEHIIPQKLGTTSLGNGGLTLHSVPRRFLYFSNLMGILVLRCALLSKARLHLRLQLGWGFSLC